MGLKAALSLKKSMLLKQLEFEMFMQEIPDLLHK